MFAAGIGILAIIGFGLHGLLSGHGGGKPKPPKISLIPNTPPPPPPPKEEKKPEPPKEQKEVQQQPEQKQTPPDTNVKIQEKGSDSGSGPQSGIVTNTNLKDIGQPSGKGTGGRGILNPFNVYAGTIKNELQKILSKRADLKRRQYRVEINVWVNDDGSLKQSELLGTTSDADTDAAIRNALAALPKFSEAPPPRMPQPIRLRIVTAGRA
jgi:outer membrane biosynthesis protein TonB